jgi:hypothetical protein
MPPTGPASLVIAFEPQRDPTALGCHRVQPRQSAASLVLPVAIQSWSLTSLQQRLFKTGRRLIRHARYFVLQLAESYLEGSLFRQVLGRIKRLAWHPMIAKVGHGGRKTERSWREYPPAGWSPRANLRKVRRQTRGRRGDSPCDAFRTAEGLVARHVICSATRGERGLGSKSQILGLAVSNIQQCA